MKLQLQIKEIKIVMEPIDTTTLSDSVRCYKKARYKRFKKIYFDGVLVGICEDVVIEYE